MDIKKKHKILILIGIIFILLPVFNGNLWFDEAYSVGMTNQTFKDIWTIGANDVHPILYYWMLKIVSMLTNGSIISFKIFSAIPIIGMSILGYTHIRKYFGEKAGFIFSFLSIFLPQMALFAAEIRMYSWAMFTVTITAIYAYRLAKQSSVGKWIIFFIASLMSIYLHYYGLMAAGLINLALLIYLIKNKRKKDIIFIICFGAVQVIAYAPWLMCLVGQMSSVSEGFWIGFEFPTTLMELVSTHFAGFLPLIVPTIVAIIILVYIIRKAIKLKKSGEDIKPFCLAGGMYLAVIVAALVITLILFTSILYYRYLSVIAGLYIFMISFILSKEDNKKIVYGILIIVAILGIWNIGIMIHDNYSSSDYEVLEYLDENIQEGDIIVYMDCGVGSVVAVQYTENQVYFYNGIDWGVQAEFEAFGPNYETVTTKDFIDDCIGRVWVIDDADGSAYEELFGKLENYEKVSEVKIYTTYYDYKYRITLIESKEEI